VKTVDECVSVYQQKLSEITAGGWDQEKYQKLLDWYQAKITQVSSAPTTTTATVTVTKPGFWREIFIFNF
jgi:hypothetical protein